MTEPTCPHCLAPLTTGAGYSTMFQCGTMRNDTDDRCDDCRDWERAKLRERARIREVFGERRRLLQADIGTRDESDPAYHVLRARKHEVGTLWAIINRGIHDA